MTTDQIHLSVVRVMWVISDLQAKKGPKSHKNGNPRMPIFTGCAYFMESWNVGNQFLNELGNEARSFSNLASYPGH